MGRSISTRSVYAGFWILFGIAGVSLVVWGLRDSSEQVVAPPPATQPIAPNPSIPLAPGRTHAAARRPQSPDSVRQAALRVPLAEVPQAPALEAARVEQDQRGEAPNIVVSTGFEGSENLPVSKLSNSHFTIDMAGSEMGNFFLFKVEGAGGKLVRVDLINASHAGNWTTLWPVTSSRPLDDPAAFEIDETTNDDGWDFIHSTWNEETAGQKQFSIVHRFDGDSCHVAMKHPLVPSLSEKYMAEFAKSPHARVEEVARSAQGRPVQMVIIGDRGPLAASKPCVFIYGREHANEQDPGWVIDGGIRFLLSDEPEARLARDRYIFLLLPLYDPDGAAAGLCNRITHHFRPNTDIPEVDGVGAWLKKWVDDGHKLDLTLNLHNVESREAHAHFFPHIMDMRPDQLAQSQQLHRAITTTFAEGGLIVRREPSHKSMARDRLSGWVTDVYGSLSIVYECNTQAPSRRLTIDETRTMGELLVRAIASHLKTGEGKALLASARSRLQERSDRYARYSVLDADRFEGRDAMGMESFMGVLPTREAEERKKHGGKLPPSHWLGVLDAAPATQSASVTGSFPGKKE